jgi:hypothetical protein
MDANRLFQFELGAYGLVIGDAVAGVEVADGLKKRRIPVPVETPRYFPPKFWLVCSVREISARSPGSPIQ